MNTPETDSDSNSISKADQSLILIFATEAGKLTKELVQSVDALSFDPQDARSLDRLIRCVHEIAQGAKIVGIQNLVETGNGLLNYLNKVKQGNTRWNEAADSCYRQLAAFLNELSTNPPTRIGQFVRERSSSLSGMIESLGSIAEEGTKPPVVKMPEEKEKTPSLKEDPFFDGKMYDLFRNELETQSALLTEGLIKLERNPNDPRLLESLMRNAHSIKGAARVVALDPIVRMTHAMEDCFVKAQNNRLEISGDTVDLLLRGVDVLFGLSKIELKGVNSWIAANLQSIEEIIQQLNSQESITSSTKAVTTSSMGTGDSIQSTYPDFERSGHPAGTDQQRSLQAPFAYDKVLRITAQHLNRLMALSGESLIESRWLYPFRDALQKFKGGFRRIESILSTLRNSAKGGLLTEATERMLYELHGHVHSTNLELSERIGDLDNFIGRFSLLSDRLFQEVVNSRMRPFADGVEGFPRMVRDLARQLGKHVRLEIIGQSTQVDRDILEKLESPLSHLVRNAVDHGIETPKERAQAGKPEEGVIKLEAKHRGGLLLITVSDDGRGMEIERLKQVIIEKKIAAISSLEGLSDNEVLNYLFLPGFSTSSDINEISGRGVGLDVVRSIVREVGGSIWITFEPGKMTCFHLQVPVTLSVVRSLLVEISGETYSLPLAKIDQSLQINKMQIEMIGRREFIHYNDQNIGLIEAWQILELPDPRLQMDRIPTIVLSDRTNCYGLVVDRILGEKLLVVREIDPRLGKIPDIIATSQMENGFPVLMIDVEEIVRSMNHFLTRREGKVITSIKEGKPQLRKRILVVDDSTTVREMETRLLESRGYMVDSAANGKDGLHALRSSRYDLVITDVDMPEMNGLELLTAVKGDSALCHTPVMIVSYKSSEEQKLKGLEAGADYYLTKSSFQDTTLVDAVAELIGGP